MTDRYLTPPALARLWGVTPETVLAMIRRGALRAFSTSPPGTRRPRWRIPPSAVAEYEQTHAAQAPVQPVRTGRRRRDPAWKEYV